MSTADEAALRAALADGGTVTLAFDGTIWLSGTITISKTTVLDGTGHVVTLSGGGANQVFSILTGQTLMLKNLTVADGYRAGNLGGGVYNQGTLEVNGCTFSNNVVSGPPAAFGGAIYHAGTAVTLNNSTFVRNGAFTLGSALSAGFPIPPSPGNIAITNCTFYANSGQAVSINAELLAPVYIVNCTFAWNTNGAIQWWQISGTPNSGSVAMWNTVVADSPGANNCQGIVDAGHNLSTDGSLTNLTSFVNTDPRVGPLMDNGGPTRTMALLPGSPAIDAANTAAAPQIDQRGFPRPVGVAADIGAYEYGSPAYLQLSLGAGGSMNIVLFGYPGRNCYLQASTNLTDWSSVATNQIGSNGTVLFPGSHGLPRQFYRMALP